MTTKTLPVPLAELGSLLGVPATPRGRPSRLASLAAEHAGVDLARFGSWSVGELLAFTHAAAGILGAVAGRVQFERRAVWHRGNCDVKVVPVADGPIPPGAHEALSPWIQQQTYGECLCGAVQGAVHREGCPVATGAAAVAGWLLGALS